MKKTVFALGALLACSFAAFADPIKLEVQNVKARGGEVSVAVYNSADTYKKQIAFTGKSVQPTDTTVVFEFDLPAGEYVFSVFQDTNNNKKLDTSLIGMPKEPVGISNFDGKGIPGGFDKLKMKIQAGMPAVIVRLSEIK